MGREDNKNSSEIVDAVKSWIPLRSEPTKMSRVFWMPDKSCRVCYECDSQFTIINRKHHCRLCGRVFCSKCTTNSVPVLSDEPKSGREDGERIRVCNFCFKEWKKGTVIVDDTITGRSPVLSTSPSSSSLVSNQSGCYTCNSGTSVDSAECSTGPFQHVSCAVGQIPHQSVKMDSSSIGKDQITSHGKLDDLDVRDNFNDQFGSCSRSDEEDDDCPYYRSHSEATLLSPSDICYGTINYSHTDHVYEPHIVHPNEENTSPTCDSTPFPENDETQKLNIAAKSEKEADVPCDSADVEVEDYENDCLLWVPPEPDDEEDEKEFLLSDDDDDTGEDAIEKWGYLRSSSFGVGEPRNRDRSNEEHRKAMERVVDGHFRVLINQLLQAENPATSENNIDESWLDIITALSWEAASLLKPDTSMGGGMDPGGYVKVKCLACGHRNESMVVKGVVCKKNVAHRRMTSKISKARLLLLGGALEYQRVANHLSSFDTLLQQEMDHLKMAVAKIGAHHPTVLLVEKSVSRYAQEYLLAKDISLVLNIKRPLLDRIARCTGAQIVPSIDNLSATKLGYCDSFHVEKFLEDLGSAGSRGKKITRTLMFFEGCPRPLGCTILLKGASVDELKKVKRVVHYGVFAAYHLALETSFLADEGASLPELPLKSPIRVALPDRPSAIDRSISTIPGYNVLSSEKSPGPQDPSTPLQPRNGLFLDIRDSPRILPTSETESFLNKISSPQTPNDVYATENIDNTMYGFDDLDSQWEKLSAVHHFKDNSSLGPNECCRDDKLDSNNFFKPEVSPQRLDFSYPDGNQLLSNLDNSELVGQHYTDSHGELEPFKEEFPSSPSDQQSILVSLSTRCVWKGSVCDRAHLLRIKYYGNFDKPLGRFLRDQLLDQGYRCRSCEMPPDAHIHCYTHQQGSLTISVRKLKEFLFSGEKQGKIWMWHRCLRCPRTNGCPRATKRVVMSDAAWGLSFGKFLELSFSNHAAASRLASCGHSLHRDCLRFYGFGRMVACFRYAPINVHSVYLPPPKVEFNYYKQDWIQKDLDEVKSKGDLLFTEVVEAIHQISEIIARETSMKAPESGQQIAELELMLRLEKKEFEESFWCVLNEEKSDQPVVDILEINRIRRKLIYHAYVWDQRLIHLTRSNVPNLSSPIMKERPVSSREKRSEINPVSRRSLSSWDCSNINVNNDVTLSDVGQDLNNSPNGILEGKIDTDRSLSTKQDPDPSHSCNDYTEFGRTVQRVHSEGHLPVTENLSDELDASQEGNHQSETAACNEKGITDNCVKDMFVTEEIPPLCSQCPEMDPRDLDNPSSWMRIPFLVLYESFNKSSSKNAQKLFKLINDYNPVYISSLRELVHQGGARLLLPVMASRDTIVPIYDDEPTSIISYTLISPDYQNLMSGEFEKQKDYLHSSSSFSILESINLFSLHAFDEVPSSALISHSSVDESILSSRSRSFSGLDSPFSNSLHARVSFSDDGPSGNVKYSVTCYFAKQFEALRRICCASELDFIRSLSRCKKWGAQGGKSNVFFAKTLDDRFIIKQVTKTELESFIKFAPSYFKYISESISTGCPTSLAKVLGIYQVTSKHVKGGKETRMDVLVMENLLFKRNITRLYDLKGSARSRYNPDSSGSNKVLLDQNLLEAMPTSPIFLGTKAKRLLERAVWNDTAFLAAIDVMDYSLLVGVDEEKNELVLGIIDFMRQYTWDKHLETWVKASGILGGPKNTAPTVISPKQYKKRFRKAMSTYFLMVPDQWYSPLIFPVGSLSDICEENSQDRVSSVL